MEAIDLLLVIEAMGYNTEYIGINKHQELYFNIMRDTFYRKSRKDLEYFRSRLDGIESMNLHDVELVRNLTDLTIKSIMIHEKINVESDLTYIPCHNFPGYVKIKLREPIFNLDILPNSFLNALAYPDFIEEVTVQASEDEPGLFKYSDRRNNLYRKMEVINCLAYKSWPLEANKWEGRHKPNNWPSKELIETIKSKGFNLAPVGHYDCSERERRYQWRIGIRGEKDLVSNLNETQIMCYVALRLILKDDIQLIHEDVLSLYHMKTVIFWCAEQESCQWTKRNFKLCLQKCINKLTIFIKYRTFPHYFMEDRNLINSKMTHNLKNKIVESLNKYTSNILAILSLRSFDQLKKVTIDFNVALLKFIRDIDITQNCIMFYALTIEPFFLDQNLLWDTYEGHDTRSNLKNAQGILSILENIRKNFISPYIAYAKSMLGLLHYSRFHETRCKSDNLKAGELLKSSVTFEHVSLQFRFGTFHFMEKQFEECLGVCTSFLNKLGKYKTLKETAQNYDTIFRDILSLTGVVTGDISTLNNLTELKEKISAFFYSSEKCEDGRLQEAKTILSKISTMSGKSEGDVQKLDLYNNYESSEDILLMILKNISNLIICDIKCNVPYLASEKWAVPDVLQYELLSVQSCHPESSVYGIYIDPMLNFFVLSFLCYRETKQLSQMNDMLTKMAEYITEYSYNGQPVDAELPHSLPLYIVYNIVAYCFIKAGRYLQALKYILNSLALYKSIRNVAYGYIRCVCLAFVEVLKELIGVRAETADELKDTCIVVDTADDFHDVGLRVETANEFQGILKEGTYKCFWNRIYLVGPYSVGKSTLARILVGETIPTERASTDGIWIYMGRAGMEVEQHKWKLLPKGTAIKEILEGLLVSLTHRGSQNMNPGNDNNPTKAMSLTDTSQQAKLEEVPITHPSAMSSTENSQMEKLVDRPVMPLSAMLPIEMSQREQRIDAPMTDRAVLSATDRVYSEQSTGEIRPGLNQNKASEKRSDINKPLTSMSNNKIHDLVIQAIKDGKYKQKIIPIDIWDFGGQKDYYMTHQLFITSRGIYMLMFNGSVSIHKIQKDLSFLPGHYGRPTIAVYLLHWVNSILTYCKKTDDGFPKIIFVATHKDKIPLNKIEIQRRKLMDSIHELFKSHAGLKHLEFNELIFINAQDEKDIELDMIHKRLLERAVQHPRWGEKMPTAWVPLELQLAEKVEEGTNIISRREVEMLNSQNTPIVLNQNQLSDFLKVQHSLGKLLYFDEAKLRDFIIINPAYMVEVLRSIVTEKQFWPSGEEYIHVLKQLQKTGKIRRDDIYLLWSQKQFQHILPHKEHMVEMLTHLDILVAPRTTLENVTDSRHAQANMSNGDFLVPCMITQPNSTRYIMDVCIPTKTIILAYTFIDEIIPPALAYRFLGSFIAMWDVKIYKGRSMLFSDLVVVEINKNHAVTVQIQGNRVVVSLVHSNKREDIVPTLASSIQECLTASIFRISEFYSTLSGDGYTTTESLQDLRIAKTTMPFRIEFGVLCQKKICKNTLSVCFFSQRELTKSSWTCTVHNRIHDVGSLHLWFTEKIPLPRCPDSCTGLGILELGHAPSDKYLCRVASMLNVNSCRQLVINLSLTVNVWEQLEYQFQHQNPVNLMFTALIRWKQRELEPTFTLLQTALIECGEDMHKLCEVFRDITPDIPGLTEATLSKKPSSKALQSLLDHIGDNIMHFGVELGLDFAEIERIQCEYKNKLLDQAREVLRCWMGQSVEKTTVRTIVKALHRIGKINCIPRVKF